MREMKCDEIAEFKIYWPGEDKKYFCLNHATQAINVARCMGLYLAHPEPLSVEEIGQELTCCQK